MNQHQPIREESKDGRKVRYRCSCGGYTSSWKVYPGHAESTWRRHAKAKGSK